MKKILAALIAVIVSCSLVTTFAKHKFGEIEQEGYMVEAKYNLPSLMMEDEHHPFRLLKVNQGDIVYKSMVGFFVGEDRIEVDTTYPILINNGTTLRFINDTNYLITNYGDIYTTFDGLYESDGHTYNADYQQADLDEFIFVYLTNGLYINTQYMTFKNAVLNEEYLIPMNSILSLTETDVKYYSFNNGTVSYHQIDIVTGGVVTIGENEYVYIDLLDALGLIKHEIEHPTDPDDPVNPHIDPTPVTPSDPGEGGDPGEHGDNPGQQQEDPGEHGNPGEHGEDPGEHGDNPGEHGDNPGEGGDPSDPGEHGEGGDPSEPGEHGDNPGEGGEGGDPSDPGEHGDDPGQQGDNPGQGTGEDPTDPSDDPGQGSGGDPTDPGEHGEDPGEHGEDPGHHSEEPGEGGDPSDPGQGGEVDPGEGGNPSEPGEHGDNPGQGTTGGDEPGGGGSGTGTGGGGSGTGTGTGSGTGGGSGTGSGSGTQGSDDPGEGGSDTPGSGGGGPAEKDERVEEFVVPEAYLKNIDVWCYAINMKLVKVDYAGLISRNISITAYKTLKKSVGNEEPYIDEETGFMIYPASSFVGRSTALRKGLANGQEFALATLQPGSTVYIQVTFKYDEPIYTDELIGYAEDGTPVYKVEYIRRSYQSGLMEIHMLSIDEAIIKAIGTSFDEEYATKADGFVLDNFKVFNTSEYDSVTERYNFENFKLNTLPYVNSFEVQLTDETTGDLIKVPIGASALKKAQAEGGSVFYSVSPKLPSNSKFTFKVLAKDRWSNYLPLIVNGDEDYEGEIYTMKMTPTAKIKETTNTTEKTSVTITLTDTDLALQDYSVVYFQVIDKKPGNEPLPIELVGTYSDNVEPVVGDNKTLRLLHDGSNTYTYQISLTSLAYQHLYEFRVSGSYNPTPDLGDVRLDDVYDKVFGSQSCYTASLNSGTICFESTVTNLLDTSATLNFTMLKGSTFNLIPLISEYHVEVYEKLADKSEVLVDEQIISQADFLQNIEYNYKEASFILKEGNDIDPKISLYGTLDKYYNDSLWESFNIREIPGYYDELTQTEIPTRYSTPLQLRVIYPKDSFKNDTDYIFKITAVVKKSGDSYPIPISMTANSFITKKVLPEIHIDELFLAGGLAEFSGMYIYDPDTVILDPGVVNVYLSYRGVRLDYFDINTTKTRVSKGIDYSFNDLIKGETYKVEFRAPAYNDSRGTGSYRSNYLLYELEFIAGSELTGEVSLKELDNDNNTATVHIDFEDLKGYLARPGETSEIILTIEKSPSMEIPEYDEQYTIVERFELNKDVLDTGEEEKQEDNPGEFNEGGMGLLNSELDNNEEEDNEDEPIEEIINHLFYNGDYSFETTPNDLYRVSLTAVYQGKPFTFSTITFKTDNDFVIVSNQRELLDAMKANLDANIIVDSDFDHCINEQVANFRGTIDFNGHVVTRTEDITTTHLVYSANGAFNNCKVYNLVYDYPLNPEYILNGSPIYNYAICENIVIRTYGTVTIPRNANLIGTVKELRNFMVKLGGDLVYDNTSEDSYDTGMIASTTYNAVIENGFIYAPRNCGYIIRNVNGSVGLFRAYNNPSIKNIIIVGDSWFQSKGGGLFETTEHGKANGNISDILYVGDYYTVGDGEPKNTFGPEDSVRLTYSSASSRGYVNCWSLNSQKTIYTDISAIKQANIDKLLDLRFMKDTFNDGFIVESSINLGFYPRVIFSDCMKKYSEYVVLPTFSSESEPYILDDEIISNATYSAPTSTQAFIRFRFVNKTGSLIEEIKFKNDALNCVILDQNYSSKEDGDSIYYVICSVSVNETNPSYLSTYTVESFTYTVNSVSRTGSSLYKTHSFSFWSEVYTVADWTDINNHMSWNYKIMNDIDFNKKSVNEVSINGSTINYTSTVAFTGKIDGQEHVFSNIALNDISNPYLIYLISGGQLKNLFFDNLEITTSIYSTTTRSGLIGEVSNALIENVRIKNSSLGLQGNAGGITGYSTSSMIDSCSIVNSDIYDINTGKILVLGGLVGYCNSNTIICNCYTRDLNIDVSKTTVVNEVGGIAGYLYWLTSIKDCYAYGFIHTHYTNVGGIVGLYYSSTNSLERCISNVEILQTNGRYAGGISANAPSSMRSTLSLGKISSTGMANRVIGNNTTEKYTSCFAFEDQSVSEITGLGNAYKFLTKEDLTSDEVWKDTIKLGSNWNYEPVDRKCFPLILKDTEKAGWKQVNIQLPGYTDDPSIEVISARYLPDATYKYYAQLLISHPGYQSRELIDLFELEFIGMDISQMAIQLGQATLDITETDNEQTYITIQTVTEINRSDTYQFVCSYIQPEIEKLRTLNAIVTYLNPDDTPHYNYWDIHNINEWNDFALNHGYSNENVNIYGTIDFGNKDTLYKEITIGSMNGFDNARFINLKLDGGIEGSAWIKSINKELNNVKFEHMTFDFSDTNKSRTLTGPINSVVGEIHNIAINDITIQLNNFTRGYNGFISRVTFPIIGATVNKVTITDTKTSIVDNGTYNYVGALVGYTTSAIKDATVSNISISTPITNYVGSLAGYTPSVDGGSLESFSVTGKEKTGGLCGETNTLNNFDIKGKTSAKSSVTGKGIYTGGAIGLNGGGTTISNVTIDSVEVETSSSYAGILCGRSYSSNHTNIKISNSTISGKGYVGGLVGRSIYSTNFKDCQVINCTITNNDSVSVDESSSATGGIIGFVDNNTYYKTTISGIVVRNTKISGAINVGGVIGFNNASIKGSIITKAYIAEDVTISARNRNVGGLVGYTNYITLSNNIVGGNISTQGSNAGGLVGYTNGNKQVMVFMDHDIFAGLVSSNDYAGGLIGLFDARFVKYSKSDLVSCLVTGNVNCTNDNVSLWINDSSTSGDAGAGSVYIYENALINGQSARAYKYAYIEVGNPESIIPRYVNPDQSELYLFVTYEELLTKTLFTDKLGFSSTAWNFDKIGTTGNTYLPYTNNNANNAILNYANHDYSNAIKGIKYPNASTTNTIAVYSSGPNTINIETINPMEAVVINGKTQYTDDRGVITLNYDYKSNITVNGVTYQASQLLRRAMIYTDSTGTAYYYYLDKSNNLYYGKASGGNFAVIGKINISGVIHLANGCALTSGGVVYELPTATVSQGYEKITTANNLQMTLFSKPLTRSGKVETYYFKSYYNGDKKIDARVYSIENDNDILVLSATQGTLHDGVIYYLDSSQFKSYIVEYNYETKTLGSYSSSIDFTTLKSGTISYITNSFGADSPLMIAVYSDNSVCVFNYTKGTVVISI